MSKFADVIVATVAILAERLAEFSLKLGLELVALLLACLHFLSDEVLFSVADVPDWAHYVRIE